MTKPGPKPEINVFGFIDEVGLLTTPKEDKIFGLGLIKLQDPSLLHKAITRYKNQSQFHDEFKFTDVSNYNLKFYKELLDIYFALPSTYFSCTLLDKSKLDIKTYFKKDYYKAYNSFVAKLIANSLDTSEYIVILADDISTPKSDHFEQEIKDKVKTKTRRNALFGICRVESHAVSAIQMVDVLLGTIAYAFKIKHELVVPNRNNAKFKLLKYLQKKLNTDYIAESRDYQMRFARKFIINEFKGNLKKIRPAL